VKNAAQLRQQIETTLTARIPAALSPRGRVEPERMPCGIAALDELLGGLPVGVLTELVGPESSGRTTVAMSLLAGVMRSERACAWIDVADTFDPEAGAANGIDLERLLWVRCGTAKGASPASPGPVERGISLAPGEPASLAPQGGGSPHPRSEGRGMPQAISAMLQAHGGLYDKHVRRDKKAIGTPGAPNRPIVIRSPDREEQVASDRLPARRGEHFSIAPRCAEPLHERRREVRHSEWTAEVQELFGTGTHTSKRPWDALDQALRTTDLLLQAGGFSVIVLDLGSTPAEMAWRIPLATWFRFRAACERTRVSLLLVTQHPCARSSAELVVRMAAGHMEAQSKVMTGIAYRAESERQRFPNRGNIVSIRKPPQPERSGQWKGEAAWAKGR
jgi:recombination protein RecA